MRILVHCLIIILARLLFPLAVMALPIHIIPEPVNVKERNGVFHITPSTRLFILTSDKETIKVCMDFAKELQDASGIRLPVLFAPTQDGMGNSIIVMLQPERMIKCQEGYLIDINSKQVHVSSPGQAGIFYAFESIRQLLPPDFYQAVRHRLIQSLSIPCSRVLDYPRYAYRGMHLDVSRHFFTISFIKKYLDILAWYKINTFHWHLTDSHGWRLEIKQYPRLTSVGAWRADRKDIPMTIAEPTAKEEAVTYGGFYTQEEVRDIIEYAKERFITIIPEIEMPGHCTAALVAYPQYNDLDNKTPLQIPCGYPGDLEHNFCVGYDSTFVFLENILKEVMQLFPAPFIHIGGDEVREEPWLHCSRCCRRMEENGLTTGKKLQAWFTHRIDSFITANGKRMIGWDEVLQAVISQQSAVMYWHADVSGIPNSAKRDLIMATYHYTYFDFYQSDPGLEPDITYAPLFLDTVYAFDPTPPALTAKQTEQILGGEACLWTENVSTPARVEYMLLPRLLALAEVLWSPVDKKDYARFITKTENQFKRFDAAGIYYAKSLYNVSIQPVFDCSRKTIHVSLSDQTHKYPIRYTTDGTTPFVRSPLYTKQLDIRSSADLKTAVFIKGKIAGKINENIFTLHIAAGASIRTDPAGAGEPANSCKRLVDGIYGTIEPYDGRWVSFHDSIKTFTIALAENQPIHEIGIRFMEDQVGNIYLPKAIEISSSPDGNHFSSLYKVVNDTLPEQKLRHVVNYKKTGLHTNARYIRVVISNVNLFPEEAKNMIFLDEIVVQ